MSCVHYLFVSITYIGYLEVKSLILKVLGIIREKFDEALDNELGTSFRELHYNLTGISTGYKRISGKLTDIPAIVLCVSQKGILRRGCGGIFPDKICGIPLGSSVGIGLTELEKTVGTLGVVVREKTSPKRVGIVSCEHELKREIECVKKRDPSLSIYNIGVYKNGVRKNDIKQTEFTDKICLNGFYTYDELNSFDGSNRVFKVGRTTGFTLGKLLSGYFSVAVQLRTQSIVYAKKTEKIIPPYNEESQGIFIRYMKSRLDSEILGSRQECYPIIWLIASWHSSSNLKSLIMMTRECNGKALGILHSKLENNLISYGIASPYFAVFEALNVEICLSPNLIESTIIPTKADSSENQK
ncbi:hypothetical protein Glove_140g33 [Diversispora epigaea]|uniref:Uncharacterized protein n=1 Tax=Diversispora epigaea TaxID=1348612 RepID=A0A397IZT6_9GLOM|nr:hypothetical protein Glove_140g33 [Diversispora epigaea]